VNPLAGYTVLDFSQYLAGPSATLRLADLGATVIKVENPSGGDAYRDNEGPALRFARGNGCFYFANRNKESVCIDLKAGDAVDRLRPLLRAADVMLVNFRPGVTQRLGLDYASVKSVNPGIVYAQITGYGEEGPRRDQPGQDLLVQAVTGSAFLNGSRRDGPVPFGVPVADLFSGQIMVQGILAALYRKSRTGEGALVQTSLLEAVLDIQFENFGAYLNSDRAPFERSDVNGLNLCHGAPYGMYATKDGHLALAMGSITKLGELVGCPELAEYPCAEEWFTRQDEIKTILQRHLLTETTAHWLRILEAADVWCAPVLTWEEMLRTEGFQTLNMLQTVRQDNGETFVTTRCPITFNGQYLENRLPVPAVGQDNNKYKL
jgi:crotonobetainyl-CoA:carnitine CoA-transferase CaiB-like acyl-CoA transferase